jgi:large subunit ribosomal protein L11
MAKEIKAVLKLQLPGGQATPAPPVGPALGQHGVNIGEFVKKFNDATKDENGLIIPAVINIYGDRTFDFVLKTPPAAVLLKVAAGVVKGAMPPSTEWVGEVTKAQVREIAEKKLPDLNTPDVEQAMRMIEGTARSSGIKVVDQPTPEAPAETEEAVA